MPMTLPTASPMQALINKRRPAVYGAIPRRILEGGSLIDSRGVYTASSGVRLCLEGCPQKPGVFLEFRDHGGEQVDGIRVGLAFGDGARCAQFAEVALESLGQQFHVLEIA